MKPLKKTAAAMIAATLYMGAVSASAAETQAQAPNSSGAEGSGARNFYQVLEDVLADFEYDLKNGQVQGLKDVAIRNIATSENVPTSFKSHIELLVTERILKNTKGRVLQCIPCKAKQAKLNGDSVVISSPETNPAELSRIAKTAGITTFMDVAFAYQPSGLILSMFIMDAETGSVQWSRSYNSETSRASAFRRGVDYNQIDQARRAEEYEPTVQYRGTVYYLLERNIGAYTGTLGVGGRVVERYDNRKKEVGFEINYLIDSASLVSGDSAGAAATDTNIYDGFNATLLFTHAWNLIGELENFNAVRTSIYVAVGGTYASGFLGGLIRAGYEWRLGKHFAVSANAGYRPPATAFTNNTSLGSVSGIEAGLGISALF